jgi:hypothetical protein
MRNLVGLAGFEPTTSCTPSERATRLRHSPNSQVYTVGGARRLILYFGFHAHGGNRMNREHHKWHSPSLARDLELLVFGHGGALWSFFRVPWRASLNTKTGA